MENPKLLLLIVVVLAVGSFGGMRLMRTPQPVAVVAASKDGATVAPDPLPAAAENGAFDFAVSYEVQACIDDKATITIQGDKVMVNEVTGEGLGGGSCSPATKNRLTVVPHSTTDSAADALVLESPKTGEYFGSLMYPLPSQEPALPPELQIVSADTGAGLVKLVEAPTGPRYRARIAFDDTQAYAHEYVVRLVLKYRNPPGAAVAR